MQNFILQNAIKEAIEALEMKYINSKEEIVKVFLTQYQAIYKLIVEKNNYLEALNKIKYCTKIYMQSSSNYSQDFLGKMSIVEREIKKLSIINL